MSKREPDLCNPSDGLFTKTSSECQLCCSRYKEICKIIAIYKGFKTIEDVDDFVQTTENEEIGEDIEW